jgi:hypothetical protein
MFTILVWTQEGPLLHFTFGKDAGEGRQWQHTALVSPISALYEETLLPLARQRGDQLSAEEVVRAVTECADATSTPPESIDWLGLALFAAKRFREVLGQLITGDVQQLQPECAAADVLATRLELIQEYIAQGLGERLRAIPSQAA